MYHLTDDVLSEYFEVEKNPGQNYPTRMYVIKVYEAWAILSETELVSLQPLEADHATLPHMKAMHVPFHLVYGSLISFKGFQSDGPKSRGMSVDPR